MRKSEWFSWFSPEFTPTCARKCIDLIGKYHYFVYLLIISIIRYILENEILATKILSSLKSFTTMMFAPAIPIILVNY